MFPAGRDQRPVFIFPSLFLELFFAGGAGRRALLARRTNGLVIAVLTRIARLGRKISRANVGGGFLNFCANLVEFLVVARRAGGLVGLQVVKREPQRVPIKQLMSGQGVNAQLQIFFRLVLIPRPARFVIHDFFLARRQAVYLVHSPGQNDVVFHRQLERFFLRQHFRRRNERAAVEGPQLRQPIFPVFLFLIVIFEARGSPLQFKLLLDFIKGEGAPFG